MTSEERARLIELQERLKMLAADGFPMIDEADFKVLVELSQEAAADPLAGLH